MAAKLQCEICGGKLIGRPGGIFECDSCGMEYDTAWAKTKIQEITGTVKVEGTVEVTGKVQIEGPVKVEGGANKEALLRRGMMALEDRNWNKAQNLFDQVLDLDPQNAEAYLGLCMAEAARSSLDDLLKMYSARAERFQLKKNRNLVRARQFSTEFESLFSRIDQTDSQSSDQESSISATVQYTYDQKLEQLFSKYCPYEMDGEARVEVDKEGFLSAEEIEKVVFSTQRGGVDMAEADAFFDKCRVGFGKYQNTYSRLFAYEANLVCHIKKSMTPFRTRNYTWSSVEESNKHLDLNELKRATFQVKSIFAVGYNIQEVSSFHNRLIKEAEKYKKQIKRLSLEIVWLKSLKKDT